MIKNRVKQFFLFIFCSHISKKDIEYIDSILNEFEKKLFFKLYKSEQKHSIRVSKACIDYEKNPMLFKYKNIDKDRLVKAALLHDVGKSTQKINILEKSFLVILNHISSKEIIKKHFLIKNKKFYRKVYVFFDHPSIAYDLLKSNEPDKKLLFLIRNHESDNINDDELFILSYFDAIN